MEEVPFDDQDPRYLKIIKDTDPVHHEKIKEVCWAFQKLEQKENHLEAFRAAMKGFNDM